MNYYLDFEVWRGRMRVAHSLAFWLRALDPAGHDPGDEDADR